MKLHLATGNAHKIEEVRAILAGSGVRIDVLGPEAVGGMPAVEEDAGTFAGNALKKARALAERLPEEGTPAWAMADDSGLCVDALDGAPGVYSSRFAGPGATDAANVEKLLGLLADVPDAERTAAFRCAIALVSNDGRECVFEERCPGRILRECRGTGGFGYDPVFVPKGYDRTFAELPTEVKNRISHRARALVEMAAWLRAGHGDGPEGPGLAER